MITSNVTSNYIVMRQNDLIFINILNNISSLTNTVSVKSAHAMWKVLMVQSCDNDFLEGLVVTNPLKPKIHFFIVGGTCGYSFYFFLNLQLK
jgi:hypothetical protein